MTTERTRRPTAAFYVFVGENRSPKAKDNGYSWLGCQVTGVPRLAMKPLAEALEKLNLNWRYPLFLNLWNDDMTENLTNRKIIEELAGDGEIIVGMGKKVQSELRKLNIPHREMAHPAARGKIRKTSQFRRHVKRVLFPHS